LRGRDSLVRGLEEVTKRKFKGKRGKVIKKDTSGVFLTGEISDRFCHTRTVTKEIIGDRQGWCKSLRRRMGLTYVFRTGKAFRKVLKAGTTSRRVETRTGTKRCIQREWSEGPRAKV